MTSNTFDFRANGIHYHMLIDDNKLTLIANTPNDTYSATVDEEEIGTHPQKIFDTIAAPFKRADERGVGVIPNALHIEFPSISNVTQLRIGILLDKAYYIFLMRQDRPEIQWPELQPTVMPDIPEPPVQRPAPNTQYAMQPPTQSDMLDIIVSDLTIMQYDPRPHPVQLDAMMQYLVAMQYDVSRSICEKEEELASLRQTSTRIFHTLITIYQMKLSRS